VIASRGGVSIIAGLAGASAQARRRSRRRSSTTNPSPHAGTRPALLADQDSEAAHHRRAARVPRADRRHRPAVAALHQHAPRRIGRRAARARAHQAGRNGGDRRGVRSQGQLDGRAGVRAGVQDVSRGRHRRRAEDRRQGGVGTARRARRPSRKRSRPGRRS